MTALVTKDFCAEIIILQLLGHILLKAIHLRDIPLKGTHQLLADIHRLAILLPADTHHWHILPRWISTSKPPWSISPSFRYVQFISLYFDANLTFLAVARISFSIVIVIVSLRAWTCYGNFDSRGCRRRRCCLWGPTSCHMVPII
ncbi:uncharacterized protein LOC130777673 [Actinidia eriantha]|uniref:uncharacterized protein LOC130777673 n=1 Tax=Actinidia eriantha TaxID=165200 RepID=UPI0025887BCA|nr:uncharacterized protein LOC130777673 [Actinidia eriantha]